MTTTGRQWAARMKRERESRGFDLYEAAYRLRIDWLTLRKIEDGLIKLKPELLIRALAEYEASIFTRQKAARWAKTQTQY